MREREREHCRPKNHQSLTLQPMKSCSAAVVLLTVAIVVLSAHMDRPDSPQAPATPTAAQTGEPVPRTVRDEVWLRSGPGAEHRRIVNQKATEALGETRYLSVDETCKLVEEETRGGWSRIRIVEPAWLTATHTGWIPTNLIRRAPPKDAVPAQRARARSPEGLEIPRTMADRGIYYLLASKTEHGVTTVLTKRVGVDTVDYTQIEIDCAGQRVRDLAAGTGSLDRLVDATSDWYELVPGSSKFDTVRFVCGGHENYAPTAHGD